MYASRLFLKLTLIACLFTQFTFELQAAFVVPDLPHGSQFQIIFVTLGRTGAYSSDIDYYNGFVRDQAAQNPDLPNVIWNAVVSTQSGVDARDNAPSDGLPIYNTAGQLVTDLPTGIYGNLEWGDLQHQILFDQFGHMLDGTATLDDHPWTGSRYDGVGTPGYRLGNPSGRAGVGDPYSYSDGWISGGFRSTNTGGVGGLPLYALSSPVVISTAPRTAGDFNGDGKIDGLDFLAWQQNLELGFLADWQANYGAGTVIVGSPLIAIPEPSTALLACASLLCLAGRMRHH